MSEVVSLLPHIPSGVQGTILICLYQSLIPKQREEKQTTHTDIYRSLHSQQLQSKKITLSHIRMEDMSLLASSIAIT
jgi:hypothetical protein